VDDTGTGLCPVEGFSINIGESSWFGTNERAGRVDLMEIGCGDGN